MSLRVTFSNSITYTVINEYGQGAGLKIESVIRPVDDVVCREVFSNSIF